MRKSRIVSHENDDLVKYLNFQKSQLVDKKEEMQVSNEKSAVKNNDFNSKTKNEVENIPFDPMNYQQKQSCSYGKRVYHVILSNLIKR